MKKLLSTRLLTEAIVAAIACTALAPSLAAAQDGTVLTLGTVQARSAAERELSARSVFTSVDIIGGDLLQQQKVDHSWELLMNAPGVQVTQFKMGSDAGRFSFRGFNGEGRINAVKLLIDGIPSNDNAGGMPYLDAVFPLDISAMEIVRGTNDARYGLHAIAGDVNVLTRRGGNDGQLSVTVGSFGTEDIQLAKGFETGAWSQNYFVGWRGTDGERDHANGTQRSFAGKWFYADPDGQWRAGLTSRYYKNTALEAGYLSDLEARANPKQSPDYARDDRSERETVQTALHLDGTLGTDWSWNAKAYQNDYRNQRWVTFTAGGAQQERFNDETHRGLILNTTWRPTTTLAEFVLDAGVDGQWQDNKARRYRTVVRERQATLRDWDFDLDTRGAYVQAVIRPIDALKIVPAYRVDRIYGDFLNVAAATRAPVYGYGLIKQPKLSASYDLGATTIAYANWGRTFQIGSGNGAYRAQSGNLSPSINEGWETGLKWTPVQGLQTRLAYWEQRASDEVATVLGVNGAVGSNEVSNVGETLRRGWDAQVTWQANEQWRAWASYSRQKAVIEAPDPSAPQTRGRQIENVPNWLASAGLEYAPNADWTFSAWGNGQGDYFVERTNTLGRYGGYALLNLSATYRLDERNSLALQLKNATDRFYVYAWYDSGSSGYSPGDGRAVYLSWTREL
ncbi:TonB-dependent receptor [Stenotrophomonas sp. PA-6-5C]|uniref:TonB-dependent receptor n=1 Tax=Stenotrophomonas sp. PA-6-5C TaxID=2665487 RepID=UPI001F349B29|nr:TonB-dependent receptor [Stenotrophomonas sp. PA-6-5C]